MLPDYRNDSMSRMQGAAWLGLSAMRGRLNIRMVVVAQPG